MAWESFGIEQYDVSMVAHNTPGYPGIHGFIRLYWLGKQRATLWFYRDGYAPIPANGAVISGGSTTYYGRFGQGALAESVDLLRHEKPVFLQWNDASKGVFLCTGQELVGEGELP